MPAALEPGQCTRLAKVAETTRRYRMLRAFLLLLFLQQNVGRNPAHGKVDGSITARSEAQRCRYRESLTRLSSSAGLVLIYAGLCESITATPG